MIYSDNLKKLFDICDLKEEDVFKGGLGVYKQHQAESFIEGLVSENDIESAKDDAYDEGYEDGKNEAEDDAKDDCFDDIYSSFETAKDNDDCKILNIREVINEKFPEMDPEEKEQLVQSIYDKILEELRFNKLDFTY